MKRLRAVLMLGALFAAPAQFAGVPASARAEVRTAVIPPEIASAGVTIEQWAAVRREVRSRAAQARVSEQALLVAAEFTGARFAASGRFNALALQQAVLNALEGQAEQIVDLQQRLDRLMGDIDPAVAGMFARARTALNEGRIREADRLLTSVSLSDLAGLQRADAEVERKRVRAAETIASRGQVAFLQADFRGAAAHYERAEAVAPRSARARRIGYIEEQGLALFEHGQRVDTSALSDARAVFTDRLFPLLRPDDLASETGRIRYNFALVLVEIGTRDAGEAGLGSLNSARRQLEESSDLFLRAGNTSQWGSAQSRLASLLRVLAERRPSFEAAQLLSQALLAGDNAVNAIPRASAPISWAAAQVNRGAVLRARATLERSGSNWFSDLRSSAEAYRAALGLLTFDNAPEDWAAAEMNLANAVSLLGERERSASGIAYLEDAARGYDRVLSVVSESNNPQRWAMVHLNRGRLLSVLGERLSGGARQTTWNEADAALGQAMRVYSRLSEPQIWSSVEQLRCELYRRRANGAASATEESAWLNRARAACLSASSVLTEAAEPQDWGRSHVFLGAIDMRLGDLGGGPAIYRRAADHFRNALRSINPSGEARAFLSRSLADAEARSTSPTPQ